LKTRKLLLLLVKAAAAILVVGTLGMIVWAKAGEREAQGTALAALRSSETVTVSQDEWVVFQPEAGAEIGLIFYPGGLVEAGAYAPILHQIAAEGVLVVITPMPLNLAILDTGAAAAVIDAYPQISYWIIAGHSLGGASAAIFAENHPGTVDAIVFWDSYPANSADLSDNDIAALSIFGTTDGQPNTENLIETKSLLPDSTLYIGIEGANHAQFGDYGPQGGDVEAAMSLDEQHMRVAEIMLDFIYP
jgi:hypothetical protein